jgi:hypothetical protein
MAVPVPAVA